MKNELVFPENATNEERQVKWQEIAEIVDSDFGFNTPRAKNDKIKYNVRLLMQRGDNLICVVKSEKYGYMQLPGGGIENYESIMDALRREAREETGFLINDISAVGYIVEKREDTRNSHDWNQAISFVFSALSGKEVGIDYTEDEIAEGFKPMWIKLEGFIVEQEKNEGKKESYSGCFSNKRDLEIAKFFKTKLSGI